MPHSRRAARELALKGLFQADVGKLPLSEAIEDVLEQPREHIRHSLLPILKKADREIHACLDGRELMAGGSPRRLKAAQRALLTELLDLSERIRELVRMTIAENPSLSLEMAHARVDEERDRTLARLRGISSRPEIAGEALHCMAATARAMAVEMGQVFAARVEGLAEMARFAVGLMHGAESKREEIDGRVAALSEGWSLVRQPAVDRNILRLAAYELIFEPDVPHGTAINEAVELAKKYSTAESGRFINGVLGALIGQKVDAHSKANAGDHV